MDLSDRKEEKYHACIPGDLWWHHVICGAMSFGAPDANSVYWRGITAPTNIDVHGWPVVKEPPPGPCQWIRVSVATGSGSAFTRT